MYLKDQKIKYIFGILLFIIVFMIGFIKINIVYSSTGISKSVPMVKTYKTDGTTITEGISTIDDNAFVSIYEEDYGYDVVFKINGDNKVFTVNLPWK